MKSDKPELIGGVGEINYGSQYRLGNRVYDSNAIAMCVMANPVGNAGGTGYLYLIGERVRRLTPRETWRLQGFPDEYFDRAKESGVSDTQLYKQAGNSVTVSVVREIAKAILESYRQISGGRTKGKEEGIE